MKRKARIALLIIAAMALAKCGGQINNPFPRISKLDPASANQNDPGFTLNVNGSGFAPGSIVLWNGSPRLSIFQSGGLLTATIPTSDLAIAQDVSVTVFTSAPGGGTSSALKFTINPMLTPNPHIDPGGLSPSSVAAGGLGATVTVTGTGFVSGSPGSVVTINFGNGSSNRQTTFVSSTTLRATLLPSDIATAGSAQIGVLNPGPPPGGGASNTLTLSIFDPQPLLTSLTPPTVTAGSADLTLTVNGSGFDMASKVFLGDPTNMMNMRTTTFVNSTQITAAIKAADVAVVETLQVRVVNPAPGGASNILGFSVLPGTSGAGLPALVDIATDGTQADQGVTNITNSGPAISMTGRIVVFGSSSTNLVPNDTDAVHLQDVFARDECIGLAGSCTTSTTATNFASDNVSEADAPGFEPSVSGDGRFIAFSSAATNLVSGANSGMQQVYLRDDCLGGPTTCTPTTTLISVAPDNATAGNGKSEQPAISPDGRFIAFASTAANLLASPTSGNQIFLRDTCRNIATGCTVMTYLVSSRDGTVAKQADGASSQPAIADTSSGQFISFTSTATNLGFSNPGSAQEIFRSTTCVGITSGCAVKIDLISTPDGTTVADGASAQSSISATGRFVVFASNATTLASGTGGFQQIYLRDLCTGASGCTASFPAVVSVASGTTNPAGGDSTGPTVSGNGQFVAFQSLATNLVSPATNGKSQVYVRNTCAGQTGCTTKTVLASTTTGMTPQQGNGDSVAPAISADGHFVAFLSTATNLVSNDKNVPPIVDAYLASTTF